MPNLITAKRLREIKAKHWTFTTAYVPDLVATLERAVEHLRYECSKHGGGFFAGFSPGAKCRCSRCEFIEEFDHD